MEVDQLYPCPLCDGPAARWRLGDQECYTINACARCGIFVVESTSFPHSWARLAPEDVLLVAFLPTYVRHCNRRDRIAVLTLENWRVLARRGRIVALSAPRQQRKIKVQRRSGAGSSAPGAVLAAPAHRSTRVQTGNKNGVYADS
jgi:hypothetical protein